MKKGFALLPVILLIVVLTAIAGGSYYIGTMSSKNNKISPNQFLSSSSSSTISQSVSSTAKQEALFSGKVSRINEDLGLFKITDVDRENGVPDSIVYYEAGTFAKGDLKGYTRILAIRPSEGPGPSMQFLLATKDRKKYVLNDPERKTELFPITDWDNPFLYLDTTKIEKIATFETEHLQTINLTTPFSLYREESPLIENVKTGKKDKNGYDMYVDQPVTEFEQSLTLKSPLPSLQFHAGGVNWGKGEGLNDKEKKFLATRNQYLTSTSLVHASDSTGLTYSYVVTTPNQISNYESKRKQYSLDLIEYKKQVELYNEKKIKEYPTSPPFVSFPGLRFTNSEAGLGSNFYQTYDSSFPGACGGNTSTYIVTNVVDNDFESVTSQSSFPLFILKDTKHPLYELSYDIKTSQDDEAYKGVNDGKPKPSLVDYTAKHPLIFFKDSFGRWVVVGEWDIKLMGGCGKPVIYLYPEQPTAVHIAFTSPVALNTQIPNYHNGWSVLAEPDGTLQDKQAQYTDCSLIDNNKFGSEYAKQACQNNAYPYIYWSGKSIDNTYPITSGGWIVEKENILPFMQKTLSTIGFTPKESKDMTDYWVPKMLEKDMSYYQISFLQTKDMNDLIPMTVQPSPDSVYRLFLQYQPLETKPTYEPIPQTLQKMVRKGFTLVEWGGLIK